MNIIHEDETLIIYYEEGEGNNTLVSFSGVDFDVFGFDSKQKYTPENMYRPEFVKVTKGLGDRFFVVDKTRCYGCKIDWSWLCDFFAPHFKNKNVVSLGTCMGATIAIKFAWYAKIDRVIAFTPHWSCDQSEFDDFWFDRRTLFIREPALASGWRNLQGQFNDSTTYIMVWNPSETDVPHMRRFPKLDCIKPIYVLPAGHNVAKWIRDYGSLPDFLSECISAKDPHKAASKELDKYGILHELF